MKITILSSAYPLRGGISHFVGLLFNELRKNNIVNIYDIQKTVSINFFPGKSQIESGDTVEKIPTSVAVDSINPLNWIRVGLKIKKDSPDLLIYKYWMPFFAPCFGTISRIAKQNKKTKILVICDNVIPHENKPGDKSLTKYFFNTVDFFVVLSKKVQQDLLNLMPNVKNEFLSHPIYSVFGESVEKSAAKKHLGINEEKTILFFGFIRGYKGLDNLLEAVALLKDKVDLKLIIAGEFYSNEDNYKKLIEKLEIQDELYLHTDFIPTSEVKYYFSSCDAVILPYKDATQSGIVQIAMNFRKPVIATNVGGLAEVVKNNKTGFIVDKENPVILAETIIKFYSENKEKEFVENIEEELEKYSWEKFVDGMMKLINY